MKFLARDPIPIFLGEAGMGHNHGGYSAQLGRFDVYYRLPPPIALAAESLPTEDGTVVITANEGMPESGIFFVPGEIPREEVVAVVTEAPAPQIGLFDVVYEEGQ